MQRNFCLYIQLSNPMQSPKTKTEVSPGLRNYYEILGVNPNSTLGQIENSYQKLALKWHPDKHTADRKLAQRKFSEISEAFDVLSDLNKRSTFDQMLNKQSSLQSAYKVFDQFFGQNQMMDQNEEKFFEKNFPQKRKNYYKILGVNKNASMEEITQAYRKLALKYHPKTNPENQEARRNFIEINEAFQTLSNQSRRTGYDDLVFGELIPRRAHDIFQDFFEDRWMEIPTETQFFRPIFDRKSRISDKWGGNWDRMIEIPRMGVQEWPRRGIQNIKEGQSFLKQERYEKRDGKQDHTAQTIRKKINNGIVQEQILKENIHPNGERDIVKTIKKGDKVDTKTYHLKRNQNLPKELSN